VRNAVRHTREASAVRVAVETVAGRVRIAVADQGPGVPESALGSLFEPFFRVDEARDRDRGGAGLGLAIAARAARLHGGDVVARNRPEGGLEVTLSLPAAAPAQLG
jgi:signal transduction histidine kinase